MRIVAGRFKGRRLAGPKGDATRPTADKVREALFSILGPLDGMRVLDLFAGTGALGIEALSRGAEHASFVERDARMRAILRTNVDVIVGDESAQRTSIHRGDAIALLDRAAAAGDRFDLVLVDPPYAEAVRLSPTLSEKLPAVIAAGGTVAIECDRRAPLLIEAGADGEGKFAFTLATERKYGDTLIRVLKAPVDGEMTHDTSPS